MFTFLIYRYKGCISCMVFALFLKILSWLPSFVGSIIDSSFCCEGFLSFAAVFSLQF